MPNRYEQLDINNRLIWNFRDIGHTMRQTSEGKGSQQRILIVLGESGPLTQSELTQRLGIQPGSASEVIIKLETAGLIARTPSEQDRRTTDVCLTEAGRVEAAKASDRRKERHEQMFEILSEGEKETLLSLLERINADWDQKYRQGEDRCGCHRGERHHGRHGERHRR